MKCQAIPARPNSSPGVRLRGTAMHSAASGRGVPLCDFELTIRALVARRVLKLTLGVLFLMRRFRERARTVRAGRGSDDRSTRESPLRALFGSPGSGLVRSGPAVTASRADDLEASADELRPRRRWRRRKAVLRECDETVPGAPSLRSPLIGGKERAVRIYERSTNCPRGGVAVRSWATFALQRSFMWVLAADEVGAQRTSTEVELTTSGLGHDIGDEVRNTLPNSGRRQVLPAWQWCQVDGFLARELPRPELDAGATRLVLEGPVEPDAVHGPSSKQSLHAMNSGPFAWCEDESFLAAVREEVAQARDLSRRLGTDSNGVVAASPDLVMPVVKPRHFARQVGVEVAHEPRELPNVGWRADQVIVIRQRHEGVDLHRIESLSAPQDSDHDLGEQRARPQEQSFLQRAGGDLDQASGLEPAAFSTHLTTRTRKLSRIRRLEKVPLAPGRSPVWLTLTVPNRLAPLGQHL